MDFVEAMRAVKAGKMITRPTWPEGDHAGMEEGYLVIWISKILHHWTITEGDLYANDWTIYPIVFAQFEPLPPVSLSGQ